MAKASYQNIRKLCSSVFYRKQTLKFAPAAIASRDASTQLLFSGDSTSLLAQSIETRSVYCRLQPMSVGKMNAEYFKSLICSVYLSNYRIFFLYVITDADMQQGPHGM